VWAEKSAAQRSIFRPFISDANQTHFSGAGIRIFFAFGLILQFSRVGRCCGMMADARTAADDQARDIHGRPRPRPTIMTHPRSAYPLSLLLCRTHYRPHHPWAGAFFFEVEDPLLPRRNFAIFRSWYLEQWLVGVEAKCSTQAGAVDVRRSVFRLEHGDTKQRGLTEKQVFVEDDIPSPVLRWTTA
jgi:hypothetical protein